MAALKRQMNDLENQLNEEEQSPRRENIQIVDFPEKEKETMEECVYVYIF